MITVTPLEMHVYNNIIYDIVHFDYGADLISHSNMYLHMDELSQVLHKYFLHRCRNSVLFSLKVQLYTHRLNLIINPITHVYALYRYANTRPVLIMDVH